MIKKMGAEGLLCESVLDLLSRKPANKITVSDITENCGLSKRSFYNYYRDREDLIFQAYKDKLMRILDSVPPDEEMRPAWAEFFKVCLEYRNVFCHTLQYKGQNNLFDQALIDLRQTLMARMVDRNGGKPVDKKLGYVFLFWTNGLTQTGKELFLTDAISYTPEEIAEGVIDATPETLRPYIE